MMVEYTHPNGYSARLYGKSSMCICFEGKEVMHTGSRSVNTEAEVMKLLDGYPAFRKMLESQLDKLLDDDDEDLD